VLSEVICHITDPRKEGAAKTETPVVEGKKAQFSLF
jgi:hypothetical protein